MSRIFYHPPLRERVDFVLSFHLHRVDQITAPSLRSPLTQEAKCRPQNTASRSRRGACSAARPRRSLSTRTRARAPSSFRTEMTACCISFGRTGARMSLRRCVFLPLLVTGHQSECHLRRMNVVLTLRPLVLQDLILFPGDASFVKVEQSAGGRTYILKFSSSSDIHFVRASLRLLCHQQLMLFCTQTLSSGCRYVLPYP